MKIRPITVYSDWLLNLIAKNKAANGLMLFPFVILRKNLKDTKLGIKKLRHETIHFKQALELLVIFFYLLYGFFWVKNKLNSMSNYEAYRQIPFEIEAFMFENNKDYFKIRPLYTWWKTF